MICDLAAKVLQKQRLIQICRTHSQSDSREHLISLLNTINMDNK